MKSAHQNGKFSHKTIQSRQPYRGEDGNQCETAQQRSDAPQPAKISHQACVPPFIQHPYNEEQRAGGKPMIDHLQNGSLHALRCEGKCAQYNKTKVADGRIGNQPFYVLLPESHNRAIEDADYRQPSHPRSQCERRLWE